jgi:hypothetical protein
MATEKPRIAVTLEQHRYDMLKRLAAAQGVSMSHLVADLLETVAEPLERVCAVLEAAKKAPQDVKDGLKAAAIKSEAQFMPLATEALDQLDMFLGNAGDALGVARNGDGKRQRGAVARSADPQPVITGVRSNGQERAKADGGRVSAVLNKTTSKKTESISKVKKGGLRHAV